MNENCEAVGDKQDADWYHEWFVHEGSLCSRGWTPLLGKIEYSKLTEWQTNCREAIKQAIDLEEQEGEVVARSWATFEETGVGFEALASETEEPVRP